MKRSVTNSLKNSSVSQEAIESKFADMNLDLSKINKKVFQFEQYQNHIENLIEEEAKLRQNVEKKTFLINENLTSEISKLKNGFDTFSKTIANHIEEIKDQILVDVKNNNNKFLNQFQSNLKRFDEYEKFLENRKDDNLFKLNEIENKISILEQVTGNQISVIKTQIKSNFDNIQLVQNKINDSNNLFNNEMNQLREEIKTLQKEIINLKDNKLTFNDNFSKINNDLNRINEKNEKLQNELNLIVNDVQSKLKHYESINKMLNENFTTIKNDINIQLDDMNSLSNKNYNKLQNDLLNQIKESKVQMDKFNINIIEENKKFIDYNQEQLKKQNDNVKQLFEISSDDLDLLKKKCETLEEVIKNIRTEMVNNINNVENYLTQRYDTIFRTMSSERSIHIK